jgi:serine protease Do
VIRLLKIFTFLVVLAGVGVLVLATAPALHGQRDDRRESRSLTILSGRGASIGVSIRDVMPAEAGGQPPAGVLIDEVRPDSPADKAGLKHGDVLVEFDGERVRSARQFSRLVQETTPGRTVKATIVRDGTRSDVQITPNDERRGDAMVSGDFGDYFRDFGHLGRLGERFPAFDFNFDLDLPGIASGRRLGISVNELTSQLADHFGVRDGLLVTSVTEGSAASRAGLKAGDVITSVDGQRVASREDLLHALRDADRDSRTGSVDVSIGIVRDKRESTLKATIDSRRSLRGRPA